MYQKYFIGIDISKNKLDCTLVFSDFSVIEERIIDNKPPKIKAFLNGLIRKFKIDKNQLMVCCESTGVYNGPLKQVCLALNVSLWVEHALRIKKASTDMRGKSDRKDAHRIAEYALRYSDKALFYKAPSDALVSLDKLNKIRETFLGQRLALQNQMSEAKTHDPKGYEVYTKHYLQMIEHIEKAMKKIDLQIQDVLNANMDIQKNIQLLTGVPGVGRQTALQLILRTDNFTKFKSAKQLACFAGVVPFKNESGTLVKRARVSQMANKSLKVALHMAALAAVRTKSELRTYYIRKLEEGKNKMSILNAVRNKLLQRIWAVIERQSSFLPEEKFRPILK
jgi:transposase